MALECSTRDGEVSRSVRDLDRVAEVSADPLFKGGDKALQIRVTLDLEPREK
jgi:hypothetical protein